MTQRGPALPGQVSPDVLRHALTERAAPERLIVARGVFTGPNPQVIDDLYARIVSGRGHRERYALHLDKGATVHTNTYFGRLPASYFQRWTTVTQVQVKFAFDAAGPARALLRASDSHDNARTISSTEIAGTGTATLSAQLNEFVDGGALWMEFTAVGGPLKITDLEWTVPAPASIRPAAIAICTFNRPDDCAATLAAIAGDKGLLADIDAIYVVDQGTDCVGTRPLFGDVAAQLGDKLVYLRQPNLGGSGGFTRGMYEVSSITDHANVILMDDDILCEPDAILRLNAFANLTPTPTIVGAQMLYMKNPRYLLAGAEDPDLARLRPGRWAANSLHNADMVKHRQNKRTDASYTGWWSCLIPAEVIAAVGLPLPMFIKWDDIEYSLRAGAQGYPTVTLPNAGVWHAEFHWKDYDDWVHYFQIRNALITAALRGEIDTAAARTAFAREIAECLASMRYGLAHIIIRAIEDFLEGPSILEDGGAAAAGRIRAERSEYHETIAHPAVNTAELTNALPPTRPSSKHQPRKDRMDLVRAKRVVYQWLGRTIPGPVMIPAADAYWWHISLFDYAVVTDASQAGVRILRRDKRTLKKLAGRARRTLRRFHAQTPSVAGRYREAFPELSSRENWARLFKSGPTG
jgi:galactofuranosylgalactofuranosylrhamnosyl-N-acetylglucosaminyl-diphospho-decaprenol beta-1,5/1,6-galactofuranosyltransferase